MNYYVPVFERIVDSSLWSEPDFVVKVFITMLVKKDKDGVVRGNAYNIGQWARKPEKEVLEALKILSSPDQKRLEPQPNEGRRIERVEDGWLILNAGFYQNLMRQANRREYQRIKQAEYRGKRKTAVPDKTMSPDNAEDLMRTHKANARMHDKQAADIKSRLAGVKAAVPPEMDSA